MRYYGGKGVHGKKIAQFILDYLAEKNVDVSTVIYVEPFCGALGVFRYIVPLVKKSYANDISKDLILLWKQVQKGTFVDPHIDQQKWKQLKYETKPSAERAFAGFGCSFGGVWFNGYICNSSDMTYNTITKIEPLIKDTVFTSLDYVEFLKKVINNPKKTYVIYMDPPYKGTCVNPYDDGKFDNNQLWNTVREYSKFKNVIVIVSELSAPKDFKKIFSFERRSGMHNASSKTQIKEKLYSFDTTSSATSFSVSATRSSS